MHPGVEEPQPMPAATPQATRTTVVDRVYDALRTMLLKGLLEPGRRLNLNQLTRELHASNTPIRRALARLQAEGLVVREPNRGFAASPLLDLRTVAELYDLRLFLEPTAAARAARRATPEVLEQLDYLTDADEIRWMIAEPCSAVALRERDTRLHSLIAEAAGNRVVACHIGTALDAMLPYTLCHRPGAATRAWEEHRVLVAAIGSGDPEGAADAMRLHLSNSRDRIGAAIGQAGAHLKQP